MSGSCDPALLPQGADGWDWWLDGGGVLVCCACMEVFVGGLGGKGVQSGHGVGERRRRTYLLWFRELKNRGKFDCMVNT